MGRAASRVGPPGGGPPRAWESTMFTGPARPSPNQLPRHGGAQRIWPEPLAGRERPFLQRPLLELRQKGPYGMSSSALAGPMLCPGTQTFIRPPTRRGQGDRSLQFPRHGYRPRGTNRPPVTPGEDRSCVTPHPTQLSQTTLAQRQTPAFQWPSGSGPRCTSPSLGLITPSHLRALKMLPVLKLLGHCPRPAALRSQAHSGASPRPE